MTFKQISNLPSDAHFVRCEKGWNVWWAKEFEGERRAHGFEFAALVNPARRLNRHKRYRMRKDGRDVTWGKVFVRPAGNNV